MIITTIKAFAAGWWINRRVCSALLTSYPGFCPGRTPELQQLARWSHAGHSDQRSDQHLWWPEKSKTSITSLLNTAKANMWTNSCEQAETQQKTTPGGEPRTDTLEPLLLNLIISVIMWTPSAAFVPVSENRWSRLVQWWQRFSLWFPGSSLQQTSNHY